jgi:hypothetical protein
VTENGMAFALAEDVDRALGQIASNTFARLRVDSATVRMTLVRGLREAFLVSATGPRRARAGTRITVRARVRQFRGPRSSLALRVPIPQATRSGRARITLSGPSQGGSGGSEADLVGLLGALLGQNEGSGDADRGAATLRQLRRRIARIARYDGISSRVTRSKAKRARIHRSPEMRISGKTSLPITIMPARRPARPD